MLRGQHDAGRRVTNCTVRLATLAAVKESSERKHLMEALRQYVHMHRLHVLREDRVLFPGLCNIVTPNEYDALGEGCEKIKHQLFGEDSFHIVVDQAASLEEGPDIYDLAQFKSHEAFRLI